MRHSKKQPFFASTTTRTCCNARNRPSKALTTVQTAANGGKGLELASECPVDAVILDYLMPETKAYVCKDRLIESEYE